MAEAKKNTVTVASKLPFDFIAEVGDVKVTFKGATVTDGMGEKFLSGGFGLTPDVDEDFYLQWLERVGDFAAVKNGAIFAEASVEAAKGASEERKKQVKSGLEQKTEEELGVKVVANEG